MSDTETPAEQISEKPRQLRLDQLLQLVGIAQTGGQAKFLIQDGAVTVNGETDTRRKRKLNSGDVVQFDNQDFPVDEYL